MIVNQDHKLQDIYKKRDQNKSRTRYAFAAKLLSGFSTAGKSLLDVGGGSGEFTEIARSLGCTTMLIDGNEQSVNAEQQRGFNAKHIDLNCPLESMNSNTYDFISCLDVIEHIISAEQLTREMARVLKPGGILLISTPNFSFLKDRFRYLCGMNAFEEGYHYRFFTKIALAEMLNRSGLVISKRHSIGSALGVNLSLRLLTFGVINIPNFRCPRLLETTFARTFVYAAIKDKQ